MILNLSKDESIFLIDIIDNLIIHEMYTLDGIKMLKETEEERRIRENRVFSKIDKLRQIETKLQEILHS